jgi:hypothetical protein
VGSTSHLHSHITTIDSCNWRVQLNLYITNQWESDFKLDIPKFQGGLQLEEFLDWVAAVGEILDFKEVPEE